MAGASLAKSSPSNSQRIGARGCSQCRQYLPGKQLESLRIAEKTRYAGQKILVQRLEFFRLLLQSLDVGVNVREQKSSSANSHRLARWNDVDIVSHEFHVLARFAYPEPGMAAEQIRHQAWVAGIEMRHQNIGDIASGGNGGKKAFEGVQTPGRGTDTRDRNALGGRRVGVGRRNLPGRWRCGPGPGFAA